MILHLPILGRTGAPAAALALALAVGARGLWRGRIGRRRRRQPRQPVGRRRARPAAPAASVDPEDAMQAFTTCMKEHGVDIQVAIVDGRRRRRHDQRSRSAAPTPGTAEAQPAGTGEFDPKAMEAADKACRDLLPSGMQGDPNATIPPEHVEQMLAFAKCMRDHGVDFPDPQFSGGGMSVQIGGGPRAARSTRSPRRSRRPRRPAGRTMPGGAPFVVGGSSSSGEAAGDRGQAVRGALIAGAGLVLVLAAGGVAAASGGAAGPRR